MKPCSMKHESCIKIDRVAHHKNFVPWNFLEFHETQFWIEHVLFHATRKLKDIGYQATSLSTYDFSTLYTTLPHNLIKEKLLDWIERTFYKEEGKLYLACNDKKAFFHFDRPL